MEYGALNAKIKAMRGNLMEIDDFIALSATKSDEELAVKLKDRSGYGRVIEGLIGEDLHRYTLEQKIYLALSDELNRIYDFVGDYKIRKFLDAFYLNNEIRVIKILLCMIYDEREIDFSSPELMILIGKTMKVDVNKVKNSKTLTEFIESLKGSQIYSVLSKFYSDSTTLFELEMQLDLYYYMHIWKLKDILLSGDNLKIINKIIATEIDLTNIIWVYRLKKHYNMANNLIYTYLIPHNYRLKASDVNSLVEAKTDEELLREVQTCPYGAAFSKYNDIEKACKIELMKIYSSFEVMHPNSIAVTIAYLFRKELEISNIISLIEGVRYKLEQKEILNYLVLKTEVS